MRRKRWAVQQFPIPADAHSDTHAMPAHGETLTSDTETLRLQRLKSQIEQLRQAKGPRAPEVLELEAVHRDALAQLRAREAVDPKA